jgi:hypothetical protein
MKGPMEKRPSQETLTLAAALLHKRKPAEAVAYALRLWHEAGALLADAVHKEQAKELKGLSLPKAFPAALKDFLRLEVHGKTEADSIKRLRDFYRDRYTRLGEENLETCVANQIKGWKDGGFKDISYWKQLAAEYHPWWQSQISRQAKESAKKSKRGP